MNQDLYDLNFTIHGCKIFGIGDHRSACAAATYLQHLMDKKLENLGVPPIVGTIKQPTKIDVPVMRISFQNRPVFWDPKLDEGNQK